MATPMHQMHRVASHARSLKNVADAYGGCHVACVHPLVCVYDNMLMLLEDQSSKTMSVIGRSVVHDCALSVCSKLGLFKRQTPVVACNATNIVRVRRSANRGSDRTVPFRASCDLSISVSVHAHESSSSLLAM